MADVTPKLLKQFFLKDQSGAKVSVELSGELVKASNGETVESHFTNTFKHLTADQHAQVANAGGANGFAVLNENGILPVESLPSSVKESRVVGTLADRDNIDDVYVGLMVWVVDATDDPTVSAGAAQYICETVTDGVADWKKTAEAESLDLVQTWNNIQGRPSSSVTNIDDAVAKRHEHDNMDLLNSLSADGNNLRINGELVEGKLSTVIINSDEELPSNLAVGGLAMVVI